MSVTASSNGGFGRYVERLTGQTPREYLTRVGLRAEGLAKQRVNVRSGTLRRSLGSQMVDDHTVEIGSRGGVFYAGYQDVHSRSGNAYLTSSVEETVAQSRSELRAELRPR